MCTVSFVRSRGIAILTSNRDEKVVRGGALPPEVKIYNGKKIIFPGDTKAGGTWFAANEDGNIAVLLNGAFYNHVKKESYRKSRGLVLLDIISSDNPYKEFKSLNLEAIEPFTVILSTENKLCRLVWDGDMKTSKDLNTNEAYVFQVYLYKKVYTK